MRNLVRRIGNAIFRILYPAALVKVPEHGLRKKIRFLFKHELRAHSSPVKLALSLSLGVCMAILPIHGFQVIILLLLTVVFHLNRPVAMVGVSVSSAPLLPFWIAAGIGMGNIVVSSDFALSAAETVAAHLPVAVLTWIRKLPVPQMLEGVVKWFCGSIVLAVLCGTGTFCCSWPLIAKAKRNLAERKEGIRPNGPHEYRNG